MTMRLVKFTFSPTRTSAMVAEAIAEGIAESIDCELAEIDVTHGAAPSANLDRDDLAIIAAPVYGGHMAPVARERLSAVSGDSTPCVIVAVYGNRAFENALADMNEFAEANGFVPVAAAAFVGEHSYSTAATPIAAGRPDARDISEAKSFGLGIARKISAGTLAPADVAEIHDMPSSDSSVAAFRSFVAEYQKQQKESPKHYFSEVSRESCSGCGACAAACPTAAIDSVTLDVDKTRCIRCAACVKACPEGARTLYSPFAEVLSANFNVRKSPVTLIG